MGAIEHADSLKAAARYNAATKRQAAVHDDGRGMGFATEFLVAPGVVGSERRLE